MELIRRNNTIKEINADNWKRLGKKRSICQKIHKINNILIMGYAFQKLEYPVFSFGSTVSKFFFYQNFYSL
jgi:hypothetical protein